MWLQGLYQGSQVFVYIARFIRAMSLLGFNSRDFSVASDVIQVAEVFVDAAQIHECNGCGKF